MSEVIKTIGIRNQQLALDFAKLENEFNLKGTKMLAELINIANDEFPQLKQSYDNVFEDMKKYKELFESLQLAIKDKDRIETSLKQLVYENS